METRQAEERHGRATNGFVGVLFGLLTTIAALAFFAQASAVVAARQRIVVGAVGMVEHALDLLSERHAVELDEERKAAMVSNLLVVLCSDRGVQPVVNPGTLYGG